jgi:hypothetical protein
MLSARLVRMIEDHAEQLTQGLVRHLKTHNQTPHYHDLPDEELHHRVYDVYRNLGEWLSYKPSDAVEATYTALGKRRSAESVPLREVVSALILTKHHLRDYVRYAGLLDSAVELYQEQELHHLVELFFDRAIYYAVCGYERETPPQHSETSLGPVRV